MSMITDFLEDLAAFGNSLFFGKPEKKEGGTAPADSQPSYRCPTRNCEPSLKEGEMLCSYCYAPVLKEKYAKHRETCVEKTGGFVREHHGHRH